jgi:hypothetical protein
MTDLGVGWAGTRQIEAIRELGRKVAVECPTDAAASTGIMLVATGFSLPLLLCWQESVPLLSNGACNMEREALVQEGRFMEGHENIHPDRGYG